MLGGGWRGAFVLLGCTLWAQEEALRGIRAKVAQDLRRLPDCVCTQIIERSRRARASEPFQSLDRLRVEVTLIGDRELYSWPDAEGFEEKELADMVGRGVIGTGSFGLLAKHVFVADVAEFTARGEEAVAGRRAVRFDYDVPHRLSSYRLRVPPQQATVGFEGSFWVDAESGDLLRLEVRALEIPEGLGLAEATVVMDYERTPAEEGGFLLPRSSEFRMLSLTGQESRNLTRFMDCRRYRSESRLSFAPRPAETEVRVEAARLDVPPAARLDLELEEDIDLERAVVGDAVRATLREGLKDGTRIAAPAGATVLGRVASLERQELPFAHYILALQFHTLETGERRAGFRATLEEAGPASGLIRQAKRMDPTFTRRRAPRLEILVKERREGQGVLHWDARQPRIRKGLRMRWRVEGEAVR